MRILVVEDDPLVASALNIILSNQNYAVEVATDGQTGWDLAETYDYDLILLDVMLPKLDGITLCRQLRAKGSQTSILLLTGRDSGHDKAIGLDAGADDYVVKPFDEEELVARVRALLRRGGNVSQPVLEWGELRLDPISCEVTYQDQLISLTPKEYALLELFLRNHRRVFSCGAILEHLWSYEETPGEEAVRTHIKGLRQKLKAVGLPNDLIETVYGIGYRLKPLDVGKEPRKKTTTPKETATPRKSGAIAPTSPPTSTPAVGELTHQQTLSAIAGVWERFKDRIQEQVTVVEQAAKAAHSQTLTAALREQAQRESHSLAGALGTFGFPQASKFARQIEHLLRQERAITSTDTDNLQTWVTALRQDLQQSATGTPETVAIPEAEFSRILVVDRDQALTDALVAEAPRWNLQIKVATSLAATHQMLYRNPPAVVLLDLSLANTPEEGWAFLTNLKQHVPSIPVLIFTEQTEFASRLAVARHGSHRFLPKPMAIAQVLETITQVLQQPEQLTARVLVVDDDPHVLSMLKTLLEPWGMGVTTLDNPERFWETLESCLPDLLILDVEMPHLSGIELCQVVRNDSQWASLPVLFLTAHTEAAIVNQVFAVGADDFVSKPVVGPELVTRILNRLERIHLLRRMAEIDPLTNLANRQKSTQTLNELLHLGKRYTQPLCLAVLDLDRFKQVNIQYGHATGDMVLRQVGQLLQQGFRQEEVVARWGGEEFVVGMYGTRQEEGIKRLEKVLASLQQHLFTAPDRSQFHLSFSMGIAQYPQDGTDLDALYRVADAALNRAKQAKGDRTASSLASVNTGLNGHNHSRSINKLTQVDPKP